MITKELVDRINFLARKKRKEGLSEEEAREQQKLYRTYLDSIREQVKDQLDKIRFVDQEEIHNSNDSDKDGYKH